MLQGKYRICIAVGEWQKPRIASLKGNHNLSYIPFLCSLQGQKQPQFKLTAVVFLELLSFFSINEGEEFFYYDINSKTADNCNC